MYYNMHAMLSYLQRPATVHVCVACRDLSTLEKIYEYFATNSHDGRKTMSAKDVVRALVPTYPPVGSTVERAGFLDGEITQTFMAAHAYCCCSLILSTGLFAACAYQGVAHVICICNR